MPTSIVTCPSSILLFKVLKKRGISGQYPTAVQLYLGVFDLEAMVGMLTYGRYAREGKEDSSKHFFASEGRSDLLVWD
eukprot:2538955-Rhodomonas_salina.4